MDYRARRLRTTLLLGTALLAGMAIGPVSSLIASYFVSGLAINAALAQRHRSNQYLPAAHAIRRRIPAGA